MIPLIVAKKGFDMLKGAKNPERNPLKTARNIGMVALTGGALVLGGLHGLENANPISITHETKVKSGTQSVRDINLELNELCVTGFTADAIGNEAKLETNVEVFGNKVDVLSPWQKNTVNLTADVGFCMEGNTATGVYNPDTHNMVVTIDNKEIYTRIEALPLSVRSIHTASPNALPAELSATIIKGSFLNSVGFLENIAIADDTIDGYLTAVGTVGAMNDIVDNCGPQVVPKTQGRFKETIENNILAIGQAIDPDLTVDVYIGSQTAENPDEIQQISDKSNVKATFDKLQESKNIVFTLGQVSDCKVPEDLGETADATTNDQARG